jgi:sulfur-oxidizing protein SoxY
MKSPHVTIAPTPTPTTRMSGLSRRRVLSGLAAASTLPWWSAATHCVAQAATPALAPLPALDERVRGVKTARGGLSLDIPTIAETGASVPVVVFVDPAQLAGRRVMRLGILAPLNPRPVVLEIELGSTLAQARLTTSIRLGATQDVIGVAQLSDGTLWQHTVNVHLTGSACFDGT